MPNNFSKQEKLMTLPPLSHSGIYIPKHKDFFPKIICKKKKGIALQLNPYF